MDLRRITLTDEIPAESRLVTYNYLSIELSRIFFWGVAEIFVLLTIVQSLPPVQSGFLFSLQFALIVILDYPTGGLGDSIGHRTVLLMAHGTRVIFFILIYFADSFTMFLLAIITISISISQESGALEAWYDNNYKYSVGDADTKRIKYTAIKGRLQTFRQTILAIVFIFGGIVADIFSRQLLFAISAIGFGLIFVLDFILLRPVPSQVESVKKQPMLKNLQAGVLFSVQSKLHAGLFFGFSLLWGSSTVWYLYLLFQTYAAYSGGLDTYTGLLRSIIFLIGIPLSVLATSLSRRIVNTERWMIIANYIGGIGFFLSVYLCFILIPPDPAGIVLWKYITVIIVFTFFGGYWFSLMPILGNRFFLDFFPDNIRNAMFSFTSSLASLVAIPIQIAVGFAIKYYDLKGGIFTVWFFTVIGNIFTTIALLEYRKKRLANPTEKAIEVPESPYMTQD